MHGAGSCEKFSCQYLLNLSLEEFFLSYLWIIEIIDYNGFGSLTVNDLDGEFLVHTTIVMIFLSSYIFTFCIFIANRLIGLINMAFVFSIIPLVMPHQQLPSHVSSLYRILEFLNRLVSQVSRFQCNPR